MHVRPKNSRFAYSHMKKFLYATAFGIVMMAVLIGVIKRERPSASGKPGVPKETARLLSEIVHIVGDLQKHLKDESISLPASFHRLISRAAATHSSRQALADSLGPGILDEYIDVIYNQWEITFDANRDDLLSLLPHTIIRRKRGSCLGVGLLFLLLAEQDNAPLSGVLLPGHFFVRYQDSILKRNIEPNLSGYNHPDAYYRKKYLVEADGWYKLENLTIEQTLAALYYNLANILRAKAKYSAAVTYYKKSLESLDGFAEAWGNLAITYVALNKIRAARAAFLRADSLNPALKNLAKNRGAFELKFGFIQNAINVYQTGLARQPGDPALLYGLAFAYFRQGKFEHAQDLIKGIVKQDKVYQSALQLQQLIAEKRGK